MGMPFSRPLTIDCGLPAVDARERVRAFAAARDLGDLEAYRRRRIVGWRLSKAHEEFVFQPEYGDSLDVEGARFVGLVEQAGSGSRIRGRVEVAALTKIVMSVFIVAVLFAATMALAQGREPAAKVLAIASVSIGVALLMVRYSLRSTSRLVEARLRQCLAASGPRAAA